MKVETFEDLIEWTRSMHGWLADCLQHCSTETDRQLAQWLMTYLADHEAKLVEVVDGFQKRADPKALHTWVYDYLGHQPIDPHRACDAPYAQMSFDDICRSVFDLHNQVIELYRYLQAHADIPETRELVDALLDMEEHETMRLAQQSNRIRDL